MTCPKLPRPEPHDARRPVSRGPRPRGGRAPSRRLSAIVAALLIAVLGVAAGSRAEAPRPQPEAATGVEQRRLATASRHMVSAANPYAAEAGREILRKGGSATDAAIAAVLVLGLVEPQSSGLGGGGFLVAWDAKAREMRTYDGRETAPMAARPDRFLRGEGGAPLAFDTAVRSGLSVGVPGLIGMLELAHRRHGRLAWAEVLQPAIRLAREGFRVSRRLNLLLTWHGAASFAPGARRYFFSPGGWPWPVGHKLANPEYARTLETIALGGAGALYEGPIAREIVDAVAAAPLGGDLTLDDVARYRAIERAPLCFPYRARRICGMGPPSSGGTTVAQTLMLLEPFNLATSPRSLATRHLIAEAERLAYADRNRYLADPGAVTIPEGLLDPAYISSRRALIDATRAMAKPEPGVPPGARAPAMGTDATRERPGTTHLSVIDGDGNAVALTATIEGAFGSHIWAAGFLLNNELTDFSFQPADAQGRPIANAVGPGKRPRSSMSPTIVLDAAGNVEIVAGSVGGNHIIVYVVEALVALIDWRLDPQQAVSLTHVGSLGGAVDIEWGWDTVRLALGLKSYGHSIRPTLMTSGTHVLARRNGRIEGGADPRREGVALGD